MLSLAYRTSHSLRGHSPEARMTVRYGRARGKGRAKTRCQDEPFEALYMLSRLHVVLQVNEGGADMNTVTIIIISSK